MVKKLVKIKKKTSNPMSKLRNIQNLTIILNHKFPMGMKMMHHQYSMTTQIQDQKSVMQVQ